MFITDFNFYKQSLATKGANQKLLPALITQNLPLFFKVALVIGHHTYVGSLKMNNP